MFPRPQCVLVPPPYPVFLTPLRSWTFSEFCNEIQSGRLPLMVPCANNAKRIGRNRDKWMLNPQALSYTELTMLELMGKLMVRMCAVVDACLCGVAPRLPGCLHVWMLCALW